MKNDVTEAEGFRQARKEAPEHSQDTIDPKEAALLVIDMQNDFVLEEAPFEIEAARRIIPKLKETIDFCRSVGLPVIYTAHVHRRDGSDMGEMAVVFPVIKDGVSLIEGTSGVEIYEEIAPRRGEIVIPKHRFSGFFGTDLDVILRGMGKRVVIVTGVSTEGCCHATARDAMYRDYHVIFLSDCTGTFDYPDLGYGTLSAEEVHRAALVVLAKSTAHVMKADEFMSKVARPTPATARQ